MFAHTIQPLHPPRDLHPPGFHVPRADFVHRAGKHHSKVQVGIGHGWQRNDGMVLRQDDAESLENTKNLLKLD